MPKNAKSTRKRGGTFAGPAPKPTGTTRRRNNTIDLAGRGPGLQKPNAPPPLKLGRGIQTGGSLGIKKRGSRQEVMDGRATMTGGGLTKKELGMVNGKIVSTRKRKGGGLPGGKLREKKVMKRKIDFAPGSFSKGDTRKLGLLKKINENVRQEILRFAADKFGVVKDRRKRRDQLASELDQRVSEGTLDSGVAQLLREILNKQPDRPVRPRRPRKKRVVRGANPIRFGPN
jgi:hypothetical protein